MSVKHLSQALGPVPQTEPASPQQVPNSAGGYTFDVGDWGRLDRFLILGSEGGSYYATERKLTKDNAKALRRCIAADGPEVVRRITAVSDAGRAPKNDPAIFALALCLAEGNAATKATARAALPKVCRIGTHLHHLAAFYKAAGGGWGRGTKRAFGSWYTSKPASELGYQLVKYQSRDGWSNRDLLRLAHPKAPSVDHATLFAWATGKELEDPTLLPPIVQAFEEAKGCVREGQTGVNRLVELVHAVNLPREAIPTELLREPKVWDAMLPKMGLTALLRNLATMTRIGLITSGSGAASLVASRITDGEALRKSRVHPLSVLQALHTYKSGRSEKGTSTWSPVPAVVDALDAAFYASFGNVESTGKRYLLALDCSPSMTTAMSGTTLTCREAAAAMAMVTKAVEPGATVVGFASGGHHNGWGFSRNSRSGLVELDISPRRRLDDNVKQTNLVNWGGTDCSLPFVWAMQERKSFDAFVVYTDNETFAGSVHPHVALRTYRKAVPGAKSAVVGMVANRFTIADPNDPGMLDVAGFDTSAPAVMQEFFRG